MVCAPVSDALDGDFGVSTGRGEYAVRRRGGRRVGTLLCRKSRPLLLRLVSFVCPRRSLLMLDVSLLVFSRRRRHSTSHRPWPHPTPPSPRLSRSLSPYVRPYPCLFLPSHGLNAHRPVHYHGHLLLVGRRYSRLSPPYLVPSSHHLLLRRPPSSPLQGRSLYPPLPPPGTTLPNLNLFNQLVRA